MKRQAAKRDLLQEYIRRLVREMPMSTILLFGSRARGDFVPYSDYDIAVILRSVNDKLKVIERLRRLKPEGIDLDLIVLSVDDLRDPLIRSMLSDRKILHNGLSLRL
ncbi:MAG: nucleotidyltransferase domain-containing protein [Thermoprotei archaeon]|nr:nucleotidyltransferase domain-containing protein [Thermoprotei archaeon]